MEVDKKIAELIYEMEYIIGSECYNPNSYNGYTGEEGCGYRYPVYIYRDKDDEEAMKYRGKIRDVPATQIDTMKYKFGSNHLFIGEGLINVLRMLEERYDIDFNELEKNRGHKK